MMGWNNPKPGKAGYQPPRQAPRIMLVIVGLIVLAAVLAGTWYNKNLRSHSGQLTQLYEVEAYDPARRKPTASLTITYKVTRPKDSATAVLSSKPPATATSRPDKLFSYRLTGDGFHWSANNLDPKARLYVVVYTETSDIWQGKSRTKRASTSFQVTGRSGDGPPPVGGTITHVIFYVWSPTPQ